MTLAPNVESNRPSEWWSWVHCNTGEVRGHCAKHEAVKQWFLIMGHLNHLAQGWTPVCVCV